MENHKKQLTFLDKKNLKFTLDIKLENGKFNITGTGNGHGGQCQDSITPKNHAQRELVAIWNKYHLNYMNAGTKEQENFIDSNKLRNVSYEDKKTALKTANLYIVKNPITGDDYKYGEGFIKFELPISFLKKLKMIIKTIEEENEKLLITRKKEEKNEEATLLNLMEETGIDEEMIEACKEYLYIFSVDNLDNFEESYNGEYKSDEDFTKQLLENIGDIPNDLPHYIHIDWEKTANDIMMDYAESNGYYFRNI